MTDPLRRLRRQYHLMPDDRGKKAWDVHRLIELSADLPVVEVPVDSIAELDDVHWFDADHQRATVRAVLEHVDLILEADLDFPIILGADGRPISTTASVSLPACD